MNSKTGLIDVFLPNKFLTSKKVAIPAVIGANTSGGTNK